MKKLMTRHGRPPGTTTFETGPAQAFGNVVRKRRMEQGVAQEKLAQLAGIERSHMGKIERGKHMPSLILILRIARALDCSSADLLTAMERLMPVMDSH
ncbi:helix-turn-helix domain-containing protein [Microvirgula aerodenitrificans]|uniref:helix-turn-helix domain-containing protein n=1 Tax=Microvirgula aerodenitrificans TaxID=57480 RepID=UPI00248EC86B|nr:helix-turn-helix transcriptional regulator [Microvirgula aerodenitrificans]